MTQYFVLNLFQFKKYYNQTLLCEKIVCIYNKSFSSSEIFEIVLPI